MSAYRSKLATIRKMHSVIDSTNMESLTIEWEGVPAGAKIFVGDCALAVTATSKRFHTFAEIERAAASLLLPIAIAGECLARNDKGSDLCTFQIELCERAVVSLQGVEIALVKRSCLVAEHLTTFLRKIAEVNLG